jgi:acetylornithine deacetylase/succinyl-diaminopimelate desuccinylase-like protein
MKLLHERIGTPSLIVCLDSGCGNYDQLWCTTSLRGGLFGTLRVQILTEGVHSGDAGGIVPSSFRIARQLLSRLEDEDTGRLLLPELHVEISAQRHAQAVAFTQVVGHSLWADFPWVAGAHARASTPAHLTQLALDRTWEPSLAVTGVDGIPPLAQAGNVLRPMTALRLALRLPPTCDDARAYQAVKQCLERDPPYGATVSFDGDHASGWAAPELAPWLARSLKAASEACFGREAVYSGDGGTIPFLAVLGKLYKDAQFLTTGVLGPHSNAHGPNEFLSLPTARKLTCVLTHVLVDHYHRSQDRAAG